MIIWYIYYFPCSRDHIEFVVVVMQGHELNYARIAIAVKKQELSG